MSFSLQKANFWKRISAFMFDAILAFCVMLGVAIGVSFLQDYNGRVESLKAVRSEVEIQFNFEDYGLSFDISEEDYNKLDDARKLVYDEANKAFLSDPRTGLAFRQLLVMALINVSISVLIADLLIFFVVPLLFKNGQTLGKKCFGIAVVRSNGVQITPPVLLMRSIIGQFAMETMVPLAIVAMMILGVLGVVGTVTLILFAVLEIGVMIYTHTNSCVHDLLTDSVVVDMGSQKIFASQEERLEYEKEEAARKAAEKEGERPIATGIFAPKQTPVQPTAETTVQATETPAENTQNEVATNTQTEQTEEAPTPQTAEEKTAENSAQ